MNPFNLYITASSSIDVGRGLLWPALDRFLAGKTKTHAVHLYHDLGHLGAHHAEVYGQRGAVYGSTLASPFLGRVPTTELQAAHVARRKRQIRDADAFLVFWDGQPGRIADLIAWARANEKPIRVKTVPGRS